MLNTNITTANIIATLASTINAMISAPNTTNGERKNSLKNKLTPFCT